MRPLLYFVLPIFCIALSRYIAEPEPSQQIITGLQQWHNNHPQEKIFVQTHKEKYFAGEQIWFKLWCTLENKPTFLSKIVYIDITDDKGNVIEKKMYQLDSTSSTNGFID